MLFIKSIFDSRVLAAEILPKGEIRPQPDGFKGRGIQRIGQQVRPHELLKAEPLIPLRKGLLANV